MILICENSGVGVQKGPGAEGSRAEVWVRGRKGQIKSPLVRFARASFSRKGQARGPRGRSHVLQQSLSADPRFAR